MIPEYQNINYSQIQSLGNLPSGKIIVPQPTLDVIKETFRMGSQAEALDMLCEIIEKMRKKIEELEGR